jgi:hypothetical protein
MKKLNRWVLFGVFAAAMQLPSANASSVRLTEYQSEGAGPSGQRAREFFEITNLGDTPENLAGWTYNDDNPNNPVGIGDVIGVLAPGESAIVTELAPEDFRWIWGLPASVRIASIGGNSNLGDKDTINIYDSAEQTPAHLVDSLPYTAAYRVRGYTRNRPPSLGTQSFPDSEWVNSAVGDIYGSFASPNPPGPELVDVGNPGSYPRIPEPATLLSLMLGVVPILGRRRR